MKPSVHFLHAAAALLLGLPLASASAATFIWNNTTGNWSDGLKWGGVAPSGADPTDILSFAGDVGTVLGTPPNYTATEDLAGTPFVLNQINLSATDAAVSGLAQRLIAGAAAKGLRFAANGGTGPQITQNGAGAIDLDLPIDLTAPLTLAGNGTGVVTMNYAVSGAADIIKNGTSTFRFGTPFNSVTIPTTGPSSNTWMGRLTINAGIIRFNNNAESGRTALRANPVTLLAGAQLTCNSEIRLGTLSGSGGNVETIVVGANTVSAGIVIHAFTDGSYGGTLKIDPKTGTGTNDGDLKVRGAAKQTLTGPLSLAFAGAGVGGADITIGHGATLAFAGDTSLGADSRGQVQLAGGTFQLDNTTINLTNRLRDGGAGSTGLDSVGGGTFQLIGNAAGSSETIGRFQLSGATTSAVRSGAVTVSVVQNGGAVALTIAAYNRQSVANALTTVDFTASGGTLGGSAGGPRILFITAPTLFNGIFGNNDAAPIPSSVGWATVGGAHFATYGLNGVTAVTTTAFNPAVSNAAANALLTGSASIGLGATFSQSSIEIAPTGAGQSLAVTSTGNLDTNALLLAGANDYAIGNTGGGTGGFAGTNTRYVHVQQAVLTLGLNIGAAGFPLVKAGDGTLALTSTANVTATAPTNLSRGTLRASLATLPGGELQFRGGVLELSGGGTFTRTVGGGVGKVNWAGFDTAAIGQDEGSGGFAAFGADATITLGGENVTVYAWENPSFVNSGHALIFGSAKGDRRVTFTNPVSLSAASGLVNYNAREIQAVHNPAAADDTATMSGVISGTVQNDLLKTGSGTLVLTAPNTYKGATIIQKGFLRVKDSGSIANSSLTDVYFGATLEGNGVIGNVQIESGGILAPGSAPGLTSILATKDLKFLGSAALVFEIGGVTNGGNGTTGYDQVDVTGTISLNSAQLQGTLLNGFNPAIGTLFFIMKNDGSDAVNGTFAQGAGITISGRPFDISYNGDAATNSFSTVGGNDVVLRAGATTPEPSSALLAASGLALLALRRGRVARKSQSPA